MINKEFLEVISTSFKTFLATDSRSNKKLKVLHGAIAKDLRGKLDEGYSVNSLDLGDGKESKIQGRYINKSVDICIKKGRDIIAGIGVKFVMQNYSQNSNNYFENLLGETANIQSNKIPYFQIFIIPEHIPYYNKDKKITKWEKFNSNNAHKYIILSKDNTETSLHTPKKTLLFIIKLPDIDKDVSINDRIEYSSYYDSLPKLTTQLSDTKYDKFDNSVILNDYPVFIEKVVYHIKSL